MRVSKRILLGLGILLFAGLCLAQVFVLQRRPTPAAAAWEPDDVAGIYAWYDASSLTGTNDGDAMSQWYDKFGGHHLTQSTAGLRPTFKNNVINGKPGIYFNQDTLQYDRTPSSNSQAVFLVVKGWAPSSENGMLLGPKPDDVQQLGLYRIGGQVNLYPRILSPSQESDFVVGGQSNVAFLLTAIFDGASSSVRTNGVLCGGANTITTNCVAGWTMGANFFQSETWWYGYVGDFIWYTNRPSTDDITLIEDFLMDKYTLP